MKKCSTCKLDLPRESFSIRRKSPDGLNLVCKTCANAYRKAWYKANRQHAINKAAAWRLENRERYRDWQKQYTKRTETQRRKRSLAENYGISPDDYEAILASQGHKCACCQCSSPGGRSSHFHVDHDHITGTVRGLLCTRCNLGIGKLGDDICSLLDAVNYLYRAQQREEAAT